MRPLDVALDATTDQLAHVQEETNGMEPSRSAVLASRKNGDYRRATGPIHRTSFSTGRYGRLTPRFFPISPSSWTHSTMMFQRMFPCFLLLVSRASEP